LNLLSLYDTWLSIILGLLLISRKYHKLCKKYSRIVYIFLFDINSYKEKHSLWTAFMSKKGRVFYIYNLRPFLGFAEILCYLLQQKRPWIYHQNMIFFISPASIIKMTKSQTIGWQINFSNNNYYWKTLFNEYIFLGRCHLSWKSH